MTKLPDHGEPRRNDRARSESSGPNFDVTIQGDVNLTPNDIAELRKLADNHPDLAEQIIKDRHQSLLLENNTERLGMVLAVLFGFALIIGTSYTLVQLGWWQSIMFVAALLGMSHVLRTILTREFSDTSWFGKLMTGASAAKEKGEASTDSGSN